MKHCIECGCIMPDDHDGDMCEVCLEERDGTIPDSLREEEIEIENSDNRRGSNR